MVHLCVFFVVLKWTLLLVDFGRNLVPSIMPWKSCLFVCFLWQVSMKHLHSTFQLCLSNTSHWFMLTAWNNQDSWVLCCNWGGGQFFEVTVTFWWILRWKSLCHIFCITFSKKQKGIVLAIPCTDIYRSIISKSDWFLE